MSDKTSLLKPTYGGCFEFIKYVRARLINVMMDGIKHWISLEITWSIWTLLSAIQHNFGMCCATNRAAQPGFDFPKSGQLVCLADGISNNILNRWTICLKCKANKYRTSGIYECIDMHLSITTTNAKDDRSMSSGELYVMAWAWVTARRYYFSFTRSPKLKQGAH